MKILGIEHVGIAVDDVKRNAKFWKKVLNISFTKTEIIDNQSVKTDIYDTGRGKIELLESTSPDSPITKFLNHNGNGIHHICLQVDDIDNAIQELNENKIRLIGNKAIIGAEGYKIIFIHPKDTGGVLVELAEK